MLNKPVIDKYVKDLGKIVTSLCLLKKSGQILNCDETGFQLQHQSMRVCARKSSYLLLGHTSNNRENNASVAYINGSGTAMPPINVVKGKTQKPFHAFAMQKTPPGTVWIYQAKVWMEDTLEEDCFQDVCMTLLYQFNRSRIYTPRQNQPLFQ